MTVLGMIDLALWVLKGIASQTHNDMDDFITENIQEVIAALKKVRNRVLTKAALAEHEITSGW